LDNLTQGLYISVVGMGILFVALGLLSLVIRLVDALFRPKSAATQEINLNQGQAPEGETKQSQKLAVAAAVAVSLLLSGDSQDPNLGQTLEDAPGNYRHARGLIGNPVVVKKDLRSTSSK